LPVMRSASSSADPAARVNPRNYEDLFDPSSFSDNTNRSV
jgi:hypothetical protein